MRRVFQKFLSACLAVSLLAGASVSAAASDALGEDLTAKDTHLHQETVLSRNVFWSTSRSDLRTENLITYAPNPDVTPIVTFGTALTERSTVTGMARQLESQGYRVVAGVNGDFYNVGTGLPIGMVVTDGQLRSSDGGYYALGFRSDGTAVIGKPQVKVTADLGYEVLDQYGTPTRLVRQLAGVNKARVSTGGIYLYTYDFNGKHTTGTTEPGVDVVCTIQDGELSIGGTLTVTVDQVLDGASATPIGPDQVVLSANLQSSAYHVDALRNIPVGTEIAFSITAADAAWDEVEHAVGALYALVLDGAVVAGLPTDTAPRTAVGQKADGTLVFYTIDGRRSGHSIGATMSQVAARLMELGCVNALCLDGGGSTTLSVTEPDEWEAKAVNRPSDGRERSVSNQLFLVAGNEPSGQLSHFYVSADQDYVLAGSKVEISASAVDTNFLPMDRSYDLSTDGGSMDGHVLTTPRESGDVTVTAQSNGRSGSTVVHVIGEPDAVAVRDASGNALTKLSVAPGSVTQLTASAAYRHLPLKADPEAFTWTVEGEIGTVDVAGNFTASAPGSGTITVSAGGRSAVVEVTVAKVALQTVEDFEDDPTAFSDGAGESMTFARSSTNVQLGRSAGRLDYTLLEEQGFTARWRTWSNAAPIAVPYTGVSMWVYGDSSGNQLSLLYTDDAGQSLTVPVTVLDFTGWKQVSVTMPARSGAVQGFQIGAGEAYPYDDGTGNIITQYPETVRTGTVYVDHITATFGGTVDGTVPTITAALDQENWRVEATIGDEVDGILPASAVGVTYNGAPMTFEYDPSTGKLSLPLPGPGESHEAMRITITARDASGNIGRASVDVEPFGVEHKFTDIQNYWGATYVDFLYSSGVTTGYDDGSFRPDQNITRAQFSVMLFRYLGLDEALYADVELPFADLGAIPAYALPAIRALYSQGIVNGSTGADGRMYFNPNSPLTRAQAATMIGRTQEKGYAAAELAFSDAGKIPAYAAYYIRTMVAQGIIGGYTDGTFRPGQNITRGQMAKILYNLM